MDLQEHNMNVEELQHPQEHGVDIIGPQQNNNARLNQSKSRHLNELFQNFTTIRKEIIYSGFHRPYKRMIFMSNYYHREVIYSKVHGTKGSCQHVSNCLARYLRQRQN